MRKLNVFLVAVMLLFTGISHANHGKDLNHPTKTLSAQIAEMLKNNSINTSEDLSGTVLFTVNQEMEIVVLSVKTESGKLEQFVKGKLNYQKVTLEDYREGRTYTLPVRVAQ